ncbi:MAG: hypothetical protein GQ577_03885 [Woeseiaceae bacterium]|nr:hypothetical protein [Woeseiaceae bacterium]
MAVAEALSRAAATFTNMAIEHKQKDDALSYSNAKNEYLLADIQERDKLEDDQDFATHDERYKTAMQGHYERLFPTVRSQRDRGLFDAEARLMNARGSVAVGDNARVKEIDWNVGKFKENTINAKAIILAATDAQTAQDAMFGVLEQGAAMRERGYFTETEYQGLMQAFVSETAFDRLTAMDGPERALLLEHSIALSRTKGEPITREQIAAGEGSGSIADFIPLDVRVKMLEDTKKANNHKLALDEAYAIMDEITARYKDASLVMAAVDEASKGLDSEVRQQLNTLKNQYRVNQVADIAFKRDKIKLAAGELIQEGVDPATMDEDDWLSLLPATRTALRAKFLSNLQRDGYGEIDTPYSPLAPKGEMNHQVLPDGSILMGEVSRAPSWSYWKSMPPSDRVRVNLDTPEWEMAFTYATHTAMKNEQDQIRKQIAAGNVPDDKVQGMSNTAMVTSWLVRRGHIPQYGRDTEDSEAYQQLLFQMDRATQKRQDEKGEPLTNAERNTVLGEVLTVTAFTDDYTFWPDMDPDDRLAISAMSSKQLETARLTWSKAATDVATTSSAGITATYKQELELMAKTLGVTPDQEAYERAYFAQKYGKRFGWGFAEVKERLLDE